MTRRRAWTARVFIGVSLDGFIARHDGDIDWLTDPPSGPRHAAVTSSAQALEWDSFFPAIDHLVVGRGTYEKVLTFDAWPYAGKRVLVLSTRLDPDTDDRVIVVGSLEEALDRLEADGADQVYVDGGQVVRTFLRANLIDEITLAWAPVLLGSGLPLFGDLAPDLQLALRATHASSGGMVHATYDVYRPNPSGRGGGPP